MKISGNYCFWGEFKGGEVYKPKAYFQGGWEKYRKINSFRITRQGNLQIALKFIAL